MGQVEASKKYNDKAYEEIKIRIKKGNKKIIKEFAEKLGISTNKFITNLIYEKINGGEEKKMNELNARTLLEELKTMEYEKGCLYIKSKGFTEDRANKDKDAGLFDHDFIIDEDNYFSFTCPYDENKESDYEDEDFFYFEKGYWSLHFDNNHIR